VSMASPVHGSRSSRYGYRTLNGRRAFHAGVDISTAGKRRSVYAAYAGTIERIVRGRKHGQPATSGQVLAPGRSPNGVIIRNPDGERQLYGHVQVLAGLRVGQKVKRGQRIGTVDLSGITTGLHLHFETWNANGTTRNPEVDFRHWGIAVGSKPAGTSTGGSSGGGSSGGGSGSSGGSAQVRAYQERQNRHGAAGLVVDGHRGPVTQAWTNWARNAQRYLNAFKSSRRNLVADGDYGAVTAAYVRDVQSRNGLVVDGILGPVMVRWMRSHGSAIRHRPANRPR